MDDVTERWLPVVGWEGSYEVSDLGRVRSLPKSNRAWTIVLRPGAGKYGHLHVCLRRGVSVSRHVHQLVMTAFVGPCPPGLETRHLDGNARNNALWNLAYGTPSENQFDRVRHGTHNHAGQTHCLRGHEFTEANTYVIQVTGSRQCKECHRLHCRQYRKRQKAAAT